MNIVMVVSMVLCAAIGLWGVFDPDAMTAAAQALVNYSLTALDWFFLLLCTFFFVFMVVIGFSKYGNIRLGGDDEVPEFSTGSWVAMLFAAGMGSGLLFWGVAEPIYHFSSPPGGMAGETPEAARQAFVITNFHWGFHAWSIYGCCALVIAYGTFRLRLPSMISTPILVGLKNVFPRPTLKGIGSAADILAVVAVIFGLAGSLAMGTLMVRSGMHSVFGTDSGSTTISFMILAALTVCFLLSASTGVDKGIKILSNINMIVAIIILLVVLFGGTHRLPVPGLRQLDRRLPDPVHPALVQDLQLPAARVVELVPRLDPDLPHLVARVGSLRRHLHRAHQPRPHHPRIRDLRRRSPHHRVDALVRGVRRGRDPHRALRRRWPGGEGLRGRVRSALRLLRVLPRHRRC